MRILLISPVGSGIGGTAQHIQTLARFLEGAGHHVETISSDNTPIIPVRGLKNPSFLVTAAIRAAFKRDFDIVNAHHVASALAMRVAPGRRVLSIHGLFSALVGSAHGRLVAGISRRFERAAMSWADVVTAESRNACRYYEEIAGGMPRPADVRRVPNGVDVSMFASADRRYGRQVISVGRLAPEKGTDNLAEIAKRLPPGTDLVILGAGPDERKIRAVAESRENVHYLGYVEKAGTIALIRGSDVLIQPSLFDEVSSAILEAMTCGTAVVASDLRGTRELITSGESGLLVDPGDPQGFADAVSGLLDDPGGRARMEAGAAEAAKEYGWDVIGRRYVELYESLL